MSLRGRYVIDRVKRAISHRFILPCPPYGKPTYWDGVYKSLGPQDTYEWGDLLLERDLLHHRYNGDLYSKELEKYGYRRKERDRDAMDGNGANDCVVDTTFGEAIGVNAGDSGKHVMLLGCGNSRMGEEMLDHGWIGPILQVDVAQKVISSMTERCTPYIESGKMDFVHDDATSLTAFEDSSMDSVVDKGLVDALFCASRLDHLGKIMVTMNRVLKPGGVFAFLSFSRPEFLLSKVMEDRNGSVRSKKFWKDVQIRALDSILMYRFVKATNKPTSKKVKLHPSRKNRQQRHGGRLRQN